MIIGKCLCRNVVIKVDRKPEFINDCNCDLCRKSGAGWGYYESSQVKVAGLTLFCVRADKPDPAVKLYWCTYCGCTTHYELTDGYKLKNPGDDIVAVNMRLFKPEDLTGIEVMFSEGRDWTGEGPRTYRRPSMTITECCPW